MLKDVDANRECIPTPEASRRSGLSKSHLTRLLKSGALEGFQLGRDWLVYADSLEKYMATPHKPGPKGPIKKVQQAEPEDKTETRKPEDLPKEQEE
jgi:excisionase family DNA binding protein